MPSLASLASIAGEIFNGVVNSTWPNMIGWVVLCGAQPFNLEKTVVRKLCRLNNKEHLTVDSPTGQKGAYPQPTENLRNLRIELPFLDSIFHSSFVGRRCALAASLKLRCARFPPHEIANRA